jgi:hypothetical protein
MSHTSRNAHPVILSEARDLIAIADAGIVETAMRSFAALRTTEGQVAR